MERNFIKDNERTTIVFVCEKVVICFAIWLKYLFQRNVINRYLSYFPLLSFYIKYKSRSMEDTQLRTAEKWFEGFSREIIFSRRGWNFFFFFNIKRFLRVRTSHFPMKDWYLLIKYKRVIDLSPLLD